MHSQLSNIVCIAGLFCVQTLQFTQGLLSVKTTVLSENYAVLHVSASCLCRPHCSSMQGKQPMNGYYYAVLKCNNGNMHENQVIVHGCITIKCFESFHSHAALPLTNYTYRLHCSHTMYFAHCTKAPTLSYMVSIQQHPFHTLG